MSHAPTFRQRAAAAMADERVIRSIRLATLHKVDARADALEQLRDPQAMRTLAAEIKQHTLDRLPDYLEQFVSAVERGGGRVHFAHDAGAARRIVCGIASASRAKLAVKSKSMTTEEIHLNAALEAIGVKTVETDLGEFIVQLDHDTPSHIVTPIIHKDRRQVARILQRELGCEYTEDPAALTMIARRHLREIFRRCDLGITGVNFGVAETGTICICTNEGNGRLTLTRPRVHVALMGIEKLVPRLTDLPVFLKLLARSATGQPLTVYTTLVTGPKRRQDPDGPEELHIVLLDNGRSDILCGPFREVLRCIRCGACLNACPVYRSVGGHAYGSIYPGPIGALVTPLLSGLQGRDDLPRASSLCGACQAACPVKIDIPKYLVMLRAQAHDSQPLLKRAGMWAWARVMQSPTLYAWTQRRLRRGPRRDADGWITSGAGPLGIWTASRDLPPPPAKSFRELWRDELAEHDTPSRSRIAARPTRPAGTEQTPSPRDARRRPPPARHAPSANREFNRFLIALRQRMGADPPPDASPHQPEIVRQVAAGEALVERFSQAAAQAGCVVHHVSAAGCAGRIIAILQRQDAHRVWIEAQFNQSGSAALPGNWANELPQHGIGISFDSDEETMFSVDAAITGVSAAIAENGTVVCESGVGLPRGASLIPPVHIAIVHSSQIVADLCDFFDMLAARAVLPANVNLITGPSKTADVEGVLVTGVHGPGAVHVVLCDADSPQPRFSN